MLEPVLPRVAAGDQAAVGQCLARYGGLVWTLARRSLGTGPEAEDAVQEIFVELWRCARRFDAAAGSETTFVATVTRRRLADRRKRLARRGADVDLASVPEPRAPMPEWIDDDEIARARAAMEELNAGEREALTWTLRDGLTQEEAAVRAGVPLGTLKSRVRRGLARLREALAGAASGEARR